MYCTEYVIQIFPAFRWIERVPEISLESVVDRKDNDIAKRLLSIDYNAEIIWLRYVELTIFSPEN